MKKNFGEGIDAWGLKLNGVLMLKIKELGEGLGVLLERSEDKEIRRSV